MASDLTVEEAMTVAEFRSALRKFLRRSELIADGCGLTPQRYLLLLMIKGARDGSGRSTVTELADRLQLAQSTVTELVARSVDAGLIARQGSSSDGRVTYLQLTPEGERRLACSFTGLAAERDALHQAIGGLSPAAYS
ncbi:MAG TPA: MarR family transcriptional regulator [Gaiellaceae bacterium]|nr:MarR family transcriptional regulator [Gaiellaceae bacterium]